jgi:hypothetical protein
VSSKISNPQIEGAFKAASLGATLIGCQSCNTSILFVYNDIHEETSQLPRSISNHIGISVIGMAVDSIYILLTKLLKKFLNIISYIILNYH